MDSRQPEWARGVSPQVLELCEAAERFLTAQRCNAVGMGAASGMMTDSEDRAAREMERVYDRTPRRFRTEAFARLHDALRSARLLSVQRPSVGAAE